MPARDGGGQRVAGLSLRGQDGDDEGRDGCTGLRWKGRRGSWRWGGGGRAGASSSSKLSSNGGVGTLFGRGVRGSGERV